MRVSLPSISAGLVPRLRAVLTGMVLALLAAATCGNVGRADALPALLQRAATLPHAVADLDGDHQLDLVTVRAEENHRGNSLYRVDLQLAGSSVPHSFPVIARAGGLRILALDVDGDHALDLVITTRLSNEPIGVWINDGHGGFSPRDSNLYSICFLRSPSHFERPDSGPPAPLATLPSRGSHHADCALPRTQRFETSAPYVAGHPRPRVFQTALRRLSPRAPPTLS